MLKKNLVIFSAALALAGLLVSCEDFLEGPMLTEDPNRVTEVPLYPLLAGIQPVTYGFIEGDVGIFACVWMQHVAGTEHQYQGYEQYLMTADLFGGPWQQIYNEGGLIDMHEVIERADTTTNMRTVAGIARMHEALIVSAAADVWGDIPYSEAGQGMANMTPAFDDQLAVHTAMLDLLDEAIADFTAADADGEDDVFESDYDFAFGDKQGKGQYDLWIAVAHTLRARILLNWAKVNSGNYALALDEALQGIISPDGNWQAQHSETLGEEFVYRQWDDERPYAKVGKQIVDMLADDPRLEFYFATDDTGAYVGSGHVEFNNDASWLNPATYNAKDWAFDLVTWEENQFIIAECQYAAGNATEALATLNETLNGIEDRWSDYFAEGDTIPEYSGLTGAALLEAIINEKYKALYLNPQVWSDWKRTGYPVLTLDACCPETPRRFDYPDDEENTNPNMPLGLTIFDRNDNDPQ